MEIYIYRNTGRSSGKERYHLASIPDASGTYQVTSRTALKIDASRIKPGIIIPRRWSLDLQAIDQQSRKEDLPLWDEVMSQASRELRVGLDSALQQILREPRVIVLSNSWREEGLDGGIRLTKTKGLYLCLSGPISLLRNGVKHTYYPDYPDLSHG